MLTQHFTHEKMSFTRSASFKESLANAERSFSWKKAVKHFQTFMGYPIFRFRGAASQRHSKKFGVYWSASKLLESNIAVKSAPFGRWTAQKRAAFYLGRWASQTTT